MAIILCLSPLFPLVFFSLLHKGLTEKKKKKKKTMHGG